MQKQPWIPIDRIDAIIQLESGLILVVLALGSWLVYKIFLREVSDERHINMKRYFLNLLGHITAGGLLFLAYTALREVPNPDRGTRFLMAYVGLFTLLEGVTVLIKTARIF